VRRPHLLLAALAAALLPGAAGAELRVEGTLHLRFTDTRDAPSTDLLFDRGSRAFLFEDYLATSADSRYGSTLAELSLENHHLGGALRWRLAIDTGELRMRRSPALAPVCWSDTSPTGLDVRGSGRCRVASPGLPSPTLPLEETRLGPAQLTSNGRLLADEVRSTLLVREAWAAWSFGRAGFATLRAGRARYAVAEGLVHDDYGTGLDAALDLGAIGPPFEIRAALFQPTRDFPRGVDGISPLALLRLDWLPSLFESAGLFLATRRDRTGGVAELVRGAYLEDGVVSLAGLPPDTSAYVKASRSLASLLSAQLTSTASMTWAGSSGSLSTFAGQRLLWTLALLRGRIEKLGTASAPATVDIPLKGSAAWVRYQLSPWPWLSVTPWFLYLSGDRTPPEKARLGMPAGYDAFLGVTPYLTATNLFFRGGLSETFAARQATAPGVNGRGVISPGLNVELDLGHDVELLARAAWLRAEDAGPWGGRTYGTEVDLSATWEPAPWITVGAELDVLLPGDFFGGNRTVYKSVLAVDLRTP
jgi:hypothetical protein